MSQRKKSIGRSSYVIFCLLFTLVMILFSFLGAFLCHSPSSANTLFCQKTPVVVLDAGHGGEDGGAVGINGVYEKDLNLSIASKISSLLTACNVPTIMTRSEDVLLYDKSSDYQGQKKIQDLANRRRIAEQYPSCIFVSIHMNAFPDPQYKGLQVWFSPQNAESQTLARLIQEDYAQRFLPERPRQIKKADESIYLLSHLRCPAVLVECGFLSNEEECWQLSNVTYQQQMSLSISLSILKYCEESKETSQKQLDFSSCVLYNEGVTNQNGGNYERRKNGLYLLFL